MKKTIETECSILSNEHRDDRDIETLNTLEDEA